MSKAVQHLLQFLMFYEVTKDPELALDTSLMVL